MMTPDLLMDSPYSKPEHKVVLYAALRIYSNYKYRGDRYNSCMPAPKSANRVRPRLLLKGDMISLDKVTLRA